MFYLLLYLFVLVVLLIALRRHFTYWSHQGIKSYHFLSTNGFLENVHLHSLKMFNKYGRIYGGYMLTKRFIVINDPDMIRDVFITHFDKCPNHMIMNISPSPKANKMQFFIPGDENWKRIRSALTPVFTSGKLKAMMSHISDFSDKFVETLTVFSKNGEAIDVSKYIGGYTMDVISACAYGISMNSINNPEHPFVLNSEKIFSTDINMSMITSVLFPKLAGLLKLNYFDWKAMSFMIQMIDEIIKQRNQKLTHNSENKRSDFIQLVMDLKNDDRIGSEGLDYLSNDEMIAQCISLYIGGYDTTRISLSNAVYHLCENKDCQQILYEELKDVNEFSYENLSRLKYLNAVIDETLRLSPPILKIQRECIKEFVLNGQGENEKILNIFNKLDFMSGIKIPAGTVLETTPYSLHRDPYFWSDPLEFKPDRFIEPTHHPYAYIPFGGGPRVCIGKRFALNEMRMCLAKLFKNFEFSLPPGFTPEYFKGSFLLVPRSMMTILKDR